MIKVGEQATPIVVIDGFIPDPLSLVETIAQHHPFTKQDGDFYPEEIEDVFSLEATMRQEEAIY